MEGSSSAGVGVLHLLSHPSYSESEALELPPVELTSSSLFEASLGGFSWPSSDEDV
jgi:hypothetical protein